MIMKLAFILLGGLFIFVGEPAFSQQDESIENTVPVEDAQNKGMKDFQGGGYYWYKKNPEGPKPPLAEKKKNSDAMSASKKPEAMSTEWLRENMPKLRDLAIDNPTRENVANYMYAQRVVLDKAQNFSQAVKEVVATDPFLDENNRLPAAAYAQVSQMRDIKKGKEDVLNHLATKGGIWVFTDTSDKCSACEDYINNTLIGTPGAEGLVAKYKFDFKKIYVRTEEGRAAVKRLDLKGTPTTVFVVPPSGIYIISQGLMAQDGIFERMLVASKAYGIMDKEFIDKANPYGVGVLTTDDLSGFSADASPSDVITNLRSKINKN